MLIYPAIENRLLTEKGIKDLLHIQKREHSGLQLVRLPPCVTNRPS